MKGKQKAYQFKDGRLMWVPRVLFTIVLCLRGPPVLFRLLGDAILTLCLPHRPITTLIRRFLAFYDPSAVLGGRLHVGFSFVHLLFNYL